MLQPEVAPSLNTALSIDTNNTKSIRLDILLDGGILIRFMYSFHSHEENPLAFRLGIELNGWPEYALLIVQVKSSTLLQ